MELNPTKPQWDFISSVDKYPAFVGGFGSGKTEALVTRSILGCLYNPGCIRGFYEPTFDLVKLIAWPRFEELLTGLKVHYQLNKSDKIITLETGNQIIFRSLENPERIVGYEHSDFEVDELDTLKQANAEEAWKKIIARNRQHKADGSLNTGSVGTTPEGFRFVYSRWVQRANPAYKIYKAPTYSNPYLPVDYIDSLREMYPGPEIDAYIEGEFVNLNSGSVYPQFNRLLNGSTDTYLPGEHLHIGMDFNVMNMSAVVHVIRNGQPIAVDEITKGRDTPYMVELLKAKYSGHPVTIYPDASGGSRKAVDASLTDLALLRKGGFSVSAPRANPKVRDRLLSMNGAFCNAEGFRRYLVNLDRCPEYVSCLEQQAYDKNGEPDKSGNLDHLPDAAGYFITQRFPVRRQAFKTSLGMAI